MNRVASASDETDRAEEGFQRPRSRSLNRWVTVFAGALLVAAGYVLSLVVTRDEFFGDARLLILETRPRLFGLGIFAALAYTAVLVLLLRRESKARLAMVVSTAPLLVLAVGLVVAGVKPGAARMQSLAYVPSARPLATVRYTIPILFQTGKHDLSAMEQARLRESIRIYIPCGLSEMRSVGFASSAPFRQSLMEDGKECKSNCRNMRLANLRAAAVGAFVKKEFGIEVPSPFWNQPADMEAARRLVDMTDGRINTGSERLNRRAELSWTASGCR